jgi:hypothetical protein
MTNGKPNGGIQLPGWVETTREGMDMKRILFWGTLAAGITAAYLMTKRGASFGEIASKTLRNPIGTFGSELKGVLTQKQASLTA